MSSIFYLFACLIVGASLAAAAENQTVITIYNAYPQTYNPKTEASKSQKICYPLLGCFAIGDLDPRFKHHGCLPDAPEEIDVEMHLNSRQVPMVGTNCEVLQWRQPETIRKSSFDASKSTVIYVHGFLSEVDDDWLKESVQLSLKLRDMNVIRVGWQKGASGTANMLGSYYQAVCNTRVVGAEIAKLVEELQKLGQDLDSVWLVGHSLGAHIMGFVGRRIPGIGRITGLDPAEPRFEREHVDARLDPTDAKFIDNIHTDGTSWVLSGGMGGFGSLQPMGHVDFYPNGGYSQPGCETKFIPSINNAKQFVVCNHERAHKIFIATLRAKVEGRTCEFKAHPCDSYEKYLHEECQDCGDGCSLVGPDALKTRPNTTDTRVKMYLITLEEAPYCSEKFFDLTAELPAGFKKDKGRLFYKVTTHDNKTIEQEVTISTDDNLEPSHTLHRIVIRKKDINIENVKDLEVKYHHYWAIHQPSTWWGGSIKFQIASIAPLDGKTQKPMEEERIEFCQDGKKAITLEKDKWTKIHHC